MSAIYNSRWAPLFLFHPAQQSNLFLFLLFVSKTTSKHEVQRAVSDLAEKMAITNNMERFAHRFKSIENFLFSPDCNVFNSSSQQVAFAEVVFLEI